jgi:hypothetical protein
MLRPYVADFMSRSAGSGSITSSGIYGLSFREIRSPPRTPAAPVRSCASPSSPPVYRVPRLRRLHRKTTGRQRRIRALFPASIGPAIRRAIHDEVFPVRPPFPFRGCFYHLDAATLLARDIAGDGHCRCTSMGPGVTTVRTRDGHDAPDPLTNPGFCRALGDSRKSGPGARTRERTDVTLQRHGMRWPQRIRCPV